MSTVLIALALILALLVCCLYIAPSKDKMTYIRDEENRIIIYHGLNVSNYQKHSDNFMPWHTIKDFDRIKKWGFNLVRFVIPYEAIEPTKGSYNEAYTAELDKRLEYLNRIGIDVVIDIHQDLFSRKFGGDGFPEWMVNDGDHEFTLQHPWHKNYLEPAVISCFTEFWKNEEMQNTYIRGLEFLLTKVGHRIVGIDPFNEPYPGATFNFESGALTNFYKKVEKMIERNGYDIKLFFEPVIYTSSGVPSGLSIKPKNGVYFPHYYDPLRSYVGSYKSLNREIMGAAVRIKLWEAQSFKSPLVFGEFGMSSKMKNYLNHIEDFMNLSDSYCFGWTYWSYDKISHNSKYAIINDEGKEMPCLEKLIRIYPQKIAGDKPFYKFKKGIFELKYKANGNSSPTVIFIPEKMKPVEITINDGVSFHWYLPGSFQYVANDYLKHKIVVRSSVNEVPSGINWCDNK